MFLTYLQRELRQRMRQTVAISLGLALGIGLVITVTAVSTGLKDAQDDVLRSLYGVGTELTVTQAPPGGQRSASPSPLPPSAGVESPSPRPPGGNTLQQDTLFSRQLGPLPFSAVASIARIPGITATVGGLSLTDLQVTGAVPTASARPTATPEWPARADQHPDVQRQRSRCDRPPPRPARVDDRHRRPRPERE